MLEINKLWTSTGSSGGLEGVYVGAGVTQSVLYLQSSTLASTQSFSMQTAISSGGPWFTEGSTSIGATANVTALAALRLTGPYLWVRPYLNSASTGTFSFRLVGVR